MFTEALVWQERNQHNLMKDFEDEVPGYLQNNALVDLLASLKLREGVDFDSVSGNLVACYEALCANDIVGPAEVPLVRAWVSDLNIALSRRV